MYAQVCARPDLAFVTGMLGRYKKILTNLIGMELRKF
jgi:hypothetical protein